MSNSPKIPVTLKSTKTGNVDLNESQAGVSLGKGFCEMPFLYKGKEYKNECYITPSGEQWCATEVDPKTRQLKKFAYCDIDITEKKTKKIKKKSTTSSDAKTKKAEDKPVAKKPVAKKLSKKEEKAAKKEEKAAKKEEKAAKKEEKAAKKEEKAAKKEEKAAKKEEKAAKAAKKPGKTMEQKMKKVPDSLQKYKIPVEDGVRPDSYILPNRKDFINWFDATFFDYRASKDKTLEKTQKFQFFNHQKLIRDYMGRDSPFRGVLLYHGLGVGKTCGSISIAESFRSNRKIIVLLNKSLKKNYRENLMKCGDQMFRLNQNWVFVPIVDKNTDEFKLAKLLGIPASYIEKQGGAWFIDFEKESNYDKFEEEDQMKITQQSNIMIDKRYTFYHMDGLTKTKLDKMISSRDFDNSILVVDEVHNLTNAMSKEKMGIRASRLYTLIMDAENLKLVFLSGTPMINRPYELGILFTLLRGYLYEYRIICKPKGANQLNLDDLAAKIRRHPFVSTVEIRKKDKMLLVTKNPYGFINSENLRSIERNPVNDVSVKHMEAILKEKISNERIIPSIKIEKFTLFPMTEELFNDFFVQDIDTIKNIELFKSRIYGLVSHYKTTNKELIPEKRKVSVIKVPMSEYQFMKYSVIRSKEIENEKKKKKSKKKKKEESDDIKSSYRAYSRIHCSFVFPDAIERPFPADMRMQIIEDLTNEIEIEDDAGIDMSELEKSDIDKKARIKAAKEYEKARNKALSDIAKRSDEFLMLDDENGLLKHSPKYNELLNNIQTTEGTCFIYTEYKTLEGIGLLSVILKANGYGQLKLKKNAEGSVTITVEPETAPGPRFAVWEGSDETSDLLRKIYNNDVDDLSETIKRDFEKLGGTNLHGEVVKLLLTTKTGAEGIDLKNVRQVHIIEPYWNPVRLDQVEGRAIRVGSHIQLPEDERNVDIFTYISSMTKEQLKTNIVIETDHGGLSSDEVLYDMSSKKLKLMKQMLRGVKEASIDCSLHLYETQNLDDPFRCVNVQPSALLKQDELSYVPNINDDTLDRQKLRRIKVTTWKAVFVKIKGKEYAMKEAEGSNPALLYDAVKTRQGRPGESLGEIQINKEGKKKVVLF